MAKKPTPQDWHKADIIAALHKKGTSLNKVAVAHGYHRTSLSQPLHHDRWPGAEVIIANAIGVPPQIIWPSRYKRREQLKCSASTNAGKVKAVKDV